MWPGQTQIRNMFAMWRKEALANETSKMRKPFRKLQENINLQPHISQSRRGRCSQKLSIFQHLWRTPGHHQSQSYIWQTKLRKQSPERASHAEKETICKQNKQNTKAVLQTSMFNQIKVESLANCNINILRTLACKTKNMLQSRWFKAAVFAIAENLTIAMRFYVFSDMPEKERQTNKAITKFSMGATMFQEIFVKCLSFPQQFHVSRRWKSSQISLSGPNNIVRTVFKTNWTCIVFSSTNSS